MDLFPAPRHVERTGPGCAPDAEPTARRDAALPPQGYAIDIDASGIRIQHADDAGLRYARATVAQLRSQHPDTLPGVAIRDWPDFPTRGYMLDVSRDRVPTRETLARIVDLMSAYRLNHLELYTEHAFAYRDHEEVWRDASPITPDDVQWLDALCADQGIELGANQNGFGHLARWLRHDAYRERAEAPAGWDSAFGHRSPTVLEPTEDNARFVLSLCRELMQNFSSRRFNIGCDETWELGQGRSRAAVEARGRGRVYLEFLQRLLDGLHGDGRHVLFWGDIVRQHPELVPELPKEHTTGLAWHYEAPLDDVRKLPQVVREQFESMGADAESLRGFEAHARPFAECDFPFWVCPGTSTWNTTTGRLANALGNLRDAAHVGLARGATGYLITDWGDNGHMAPPSVAFGPLAYGAAVSWCLESNRAADVAQVLDRVVFGDESAGLGSAITELGSVYAGTGVFSPNGSPLHYALLARGATGRALIGAPDPARLEAVLGRIADATGQIERSQPASVDGDLARRELVQAARLARHGAWRIARAHDLPRPSDGELALDLREAIAEQRACWLERSRPGGLHDSIARLERALEEYA